MKVIYIAGPFRGKTTWDVVRNVRRAEEWALTVACAGAMPLCPHLNTQNFGGLLCDEFWLVGTMELMRRCDAVFLIPGWECSVGANAEKDEALRLGMPVFTDIEDVRSFAGKGA